MRSSCLCLAVLLVVPCADAAPAPDAFKQKLEALKKRLPEVLNKWLEENNGFWVMNPNPRAGKVSCKPEVRVLRRIGPNQAKAVIFFAAYLDEERTPHWDIVLTVYLTYQDGCWTTGKFKAYSRGVDEKVLQPHFGFLMMAIDEAAEK